MQPMLRIACSKLRRTSKPQISMLPCVGLMRPTSMRIVVVLPAPLGPRKPKTSPAWMAKEMLSTIVRLPMTLIRLRATRTGSMRRFLYWYVPLGAALIAAAVFANGFYSFARGETGTPVNVAAARRTGSAPPAGTIAPIILGDSLARGTGDETGLGIGGRLVDDLRQRKIKTNNIINLAVNGSRTADLLQLLESHNVQVLL